MPNYNQQQKWSLENLAKKNHVVDAGAWLHTDEDIVAFWKAEAEKNWLKVGMEVVGCSIYDTTGQIMTVVAISGPYATCQWFKGEEVNSDYFYYRELARVREGTPGFHR